MPRNRFAFPWRRLPSRTYRLLLSRRVPLRDKLLFVVPVALYWVLPDFLPFLPIDDAAVTVFAASWFVGAMERKYGTDGGESIG